MIKIIEGNPSNTGYKPARFTHFYFDPFGVKIATKFCIKHASFKLRAALLSATLSVIFWFKHF